MKSIVHLVLAAPTVIAWLVPTRGSLMGAIAAPTRGFVLVMLTPYLHFCLKPKFVFSLEEIRMRLMYLGNRLIQPADVTADVRACVLHRAATKGIGYRTMIIQHLRHTFVV